MIENNDIIINNKNKCTLHPNKKLNLLCLDCINGTSSKGEHHGLAFQDNCNYLSKLKDKEKPNNTVVYYVSKLGLKKLEFNKEGKWKLIIKDNQIYTDNESIKDLSSIIRKFVNDKLYQKVKDEEVVIAKKRIWRENHKDWIHWINGWRHIPKHVEATVWDATLSLMKNRMSLVHQDATFAGDRRCRLCSTAEGSIEHLVSGCTTMYKTGVIPRHDSIAKEIIKTLINRYQIPKVTNLLEPEIKYTETDSHGMVITKVKINIDMNFKNSTSIHYKPDIVVFDYVAKLIRVVDVCVPYDRNIIKRKWEKIDKYSYFINYFKNHYKDENDKSFDVQIVPIITGALGSIISTNTTHTINNATHPIRTLKECVHQLPLSNIERTFDKENPKTCYHRYFTFT
ncbi:hypothetical protein ACTFIZ_001737 [Dictyostelium cf. discoideum]